MEQRLPKLLRWKRERRKNQKARARQQRAVSQKPVSLHDKKKLCVESRIAHSKCCYKYLLYFHRVCPVYLCLLGIGF